MKSQYRVVVIGGGVVGASIIYHLAKMGWSDICLIERSVLTAGSSWHAAGGVHALNADPNIAALQAYTIDLLDEISDESGLDIGMLATSHGVIWRSYIGEIVLGVETDTLDRGVDPPPRGTGRQFELQILDALA